MNPFRAAGYGQSNPIAGTTWDRPDVETTLLRSKAIAPADPKNEPLFDAGWTNTPAIGNRDSYFRYQLLHRTASALLTAIDFHAATAVMLVHAFETPADRKIDFTAFCQAMGASEVTPDLFMVPGFTTPSLYLAWCDGNNEYRNVQLDSRL